MASTIREVRWRVRCDEMLATFLISLAQFSVYQKQPKGVQYDVTSTMVAGMMATRRTMTCRIEWQGYIDFANVKRACRH